jgi:hypothetical protein
MAAIITNTQSGPIDSDMPLTFNIGALMRYFWNTNRTMAVFFVATVISLAVSVVGMMIDPRMVLGQSTWAKPTKFMLSFLFYIPTMYWLYSHVNIRPRIKSFVMTGSAAILLLELVLLMLQAGRGVPMHFNVSTPFNATLWSIMSVSIMIFYVISIIGGGLLVVQQMKDRTYGMSLRFGVILMLVGFGLGFLMTSPSSSQMEALQAGETVPMIGAHTVGAADGGAGIPLLGWSTEHGDLRIAHFVGIHGAQFMLIMGWLVTVVAQRLNLSEGRKLALVWGSFLIYLSLTLLTAWQGLRGESIIQPSLLTIAVAGALVAVTLIYHAAVIVAPRRMAA